MSLVRRDPFARTELHRELVTVPASTTCGWCGQKRHYKGKETDKLFQFYSESDAGRRAMIRGLFCSTGCMESFHN